MVRHNLNQGKKKETRCVPQFEEKETGHFLVFSVVVLCVFMF